MDGAADADDELTDVGSLGCEALAPVVASFGIGGRGGITSAAPAPSGASNVRSEADATISCVGGAFALGFG